MNTNELIERLARSAEPVRPLPQPWLRATVWLVGAGLYFGVLMLLMVSNDALAADATPSFLFEQLAAVMTGIAAAAAAFASVVPGYSRRVLLLPLAPAIWWFGGIANRALDEWPAGAATALAATHEWLCVAMIAMGGVLPTLGIVLMLRRGAPLTPRSTTALGVVAATALANVAACLSYPHPSSLTVLTWHGGTMLALLGLASVAGRSLFQWRATPEAVRS